METHSNISIGSRRAVIPQEVILLTAEANYTNVHFSNGRKLMVATTLKELEKRFSACAMFFRIHKSFLINLSYISRCEHADNELFVQMKHNHRASVSRRKKAAFLKQFLQ